MHSSWNLRMWFKNEVGEVSEGEVPKTRHWRWSELGHQWGKRLLMRGADCWIFILCVLMDLAAEQYKTLYKWTHYHIPKLYIHVYNILWYNGGGSQPFNKYTCFSACIVCTTTLGCSNIKEIKLFKVEEEIIHTLFMSGHGKFMYHIVKKTLNKNHGIRRD